MGQLRRPAVVPCSVKLEIEEDVLAEVEMPAPRAQRLIKSFDRLERQSRPAGSDDERCDRHVKPVDDPGAEEAGHRDAAAFDEHASVSVFSERLEDCCGFELIAAVRGNRQDIAGGGRCGIACWLRRTTGVRAAPPEKTASGSRRALGSRTTRRILALGLPHGQRELSVTMGPAPTTTASTTGDGAAGYRLPRDMVRVATFCRDAAVEALPQLCDDQMRP